MSDGRLKRNTSQPEFLVFPPKPTLPPVFSSHLGGASVLLAAQTKTLALDPSFCHRPIFDQSANPASSIFITQQLCTTTQLRSYYRAASPCQPLPAPRQSSHLRGLPASILLSLPSSLKATARSYLLKEISQVLSLSCSQTFLLLLFPNKN